MSKLSIKDFDPDSWVLHKIMVDTTITLYRTSKIKDFELEQVRDILEKLTLKTDPLQLALASMINAIFTQRASVFMITKRSLSKLMYHDQNHDGTLCHDRVYTVMMNNLKNSGVIEVLEKPAGRKGGLYRLTDSDLVELLKLTMIDSSYEEVEKVRIEQFYNMNGKVDHENDEDFKAFNKSMERQRARKKRS